MKCLHDMNYNEVMLDYLLFLMMKDDVETAKELLQVYHMFTLYTSYCQHKIVIIFLPINLNICFGCLKELSH